MAGDDEEFPWPPEPVMAMRRRQALMNDPPAYKRYMSFVDSLPPEAVQDIDSLREEYMPLIESDCSRIIRAAYNRHAHQPLGFIVAQAIVKLRDYPFAIAHDQHAALAQRVDDILKRYPVSGDERYASVMATHMLLVAQEDLEVDLVLRVLREKKVPEEEIATVYRPQTPLPPEEPFLSNLRQLFRHAPGATPPAANENEPRR